MAIPEVNEAIIEDPTPSFNTVLMLDLTVAPLDPPLRLHNKKFLQLEKQERAISNHAGGIDTCVSVEGFYKDRYADLAQEFVQTRKDAHGTKPTDMSARSMKEKVKEFYEMCFRGETAALQIVVGEFRRTRHWHGGRPKGTYCYKCRLK